MKYNKVLPTILGILAFYLPVSFAAGDIFPEAQNDSKNVSVTPSKKLVQARKKSSSKRTSSGTNGLATTEKAPSTPVSHRILVKNGSPESSGSSSSSASGSSEELLDFDVEQGSSFKLNIPEKRQGYVKGFVDRLLGKDDKPTQLKKMGYLAEKMSDRDVKVILAALLRKATVSGQADARDLVNALPSANVHLVNQMSNQIKSRSAHLMKGSTLMAIISFSFAAYIYRFAQSGIVTPLDEDALGALSYFIMGFAFKHLFGTTINWARNRTHHA